METLACPATFFIPGPESPHIRENLCMFLFCMQSLPRLGPSLWGEPLLVTVDHCFSPQGTFNNVWRCLGCHNWGGGTTGIWWLEVRILQNTLQWTGQPHTTKIFLVQNVSGGKVENPCRRLRSSLKLIYLAYTRITHALPSGKEGRILVINEESGWTEIDPS